jgi:hypothetical protein
MPARPKLEAITTKAGSDMRQGQIQFNVAVADTSGAAFGLSSSRVLAWSSTTANNTTQALQTLGRGSTDTAVASGAFRFIITGQAASEAKAAVTTGTAVTAQTVPADTWALYVFDVPTGGTIAMTPAALNTTGYATEAAAIAACPARITAKARLGYITVKTKASTAWIGATDALAGGSSGNPASVTNYYPVVGVFGATGVPATLSNFPGLTSPQGLWSGGQCGVLQGTTFSAGSNDYALQTTAFTFNTGGAVDINKAAVTAGTAFGALGTIPTSKWGLIAVFINGAGTFSFTSAPSNYTSGYSSESAAIGDLAKMTPTTGLCFVGYLTVKSSSNAAGWVTGTDALAGGSTGNPAAATNYYPTIGVDTATTGPDFSGQTAAQIAGRAGKPLTSANY